MSDLSNRGPTGSLTNTRHIDQGTLIRSLSRQPEVRGINLKLEPLYITPISEDPGLAKKFEVGEEVYWELGLAGQIAEKFLWLPYRKGKITFKTGKLKGKGLVCTSFVKIFGAIWFSGDPLNQEKLGTRSPAAVYARKYGGHEVNKKRLRLKTLVNMLSKDRLYAVVTYKTKVSDTRQHVWLLVFSKSLDDWVRIESTGWALKKGGKGPGPGIYRLKYPKNSKRFYYEAWDWGPALKERNQDIDTWQFTT